MARKTGSHGDITGPKVHAAALRLIARHGFAAVSMRQIAHEVGVQAGALYRYTPDKQTLLFDLMLGHMDALLAARAAAEPWRPSWTSRARSSASSPALESSVLVVALVMLVLVLLVRLLWVLVWCGGW